MVKLGRELICLIIILLFIFLLRLPSTNEIVLNIDEGAAFTVAQSIVGGGRLYQDVWDHRGPFFYLILVPIIKLFGNSIFAIRLFLSLWVLLSAFFLYLAARHIFDQWTALFSVLIYGLFLMNHGGTSYAPEIMMMLPIIFASYFFIRYLKNKRQNTLFWCGFFSAISILFKPPAMFTALTFPFFIFTQHFYVRIKKFNAGIIHPISLLKKILIFLIGGLLVLVTTLFYFWSRRIPLYEFYYSFYKFNAVYSKFLTFSQAYNTMIDRIFMLLQSDVLTVAFLISIILVFLFIRKINSENTKFILLIFFFSFFGVFYCRKGYDHYWIQMALAYALIIPLAIHAIPIKYNKKIIPAVQKSIPLLCVLLLIIIIPLSINNFNKSKEKNRSDINIKIAKYITLHTSEKDTLFLLGVQPIIHFIAERKPATRYFYWLFHHGKKYDLLLQRNISYFNQLPEYIIYDLNKQTFPQYHELISNYYFLDKTEGSISFFKRNETKTKNITNIVI